MRLGRASWIASLAEGSQIRALTRALVSRFPPKESQCSDVATASMTYDYSIDDIFASLIPCGVRLEEVFLQIKLVLDHGSNCFYGSAMESALPFRVDYRLAKSMFQIRVIGYGIG